VRFDLTRYDWKQQDHLLQVAGEIGCHGGKFVAIDPGADGAALAFDLGSTVPVAVCHAQDAFAVADLMRRVSASVLVVEGQFVGDPKRAGAALDLSFRTGITIGAVAVMLAAKTHLFTVPPATWQAHQRKLEGIPERLNREDGIALSVKVAEREIGKQRTWVSATKGQREGMASALGIGHWWRSL
jgi:hypothetical protein